MILELNRNLKRIHDEAKDRWREGGAGSDMRENIDGVEVAIKYEGSNRSTDYWTVMLDGTHFARQTDHTPWNFLKPMTTSYTCFIDLTEKKCHAFMADAGFARGEYEAQEEWYPPEKGEPRFHVIVREIEQVVRLWKAWYSSYKGASHVPLQKR